jgi:hypothetical protein
MRAEAMSGLHLTGAPAKSRSASVGTPTRPRNSPEGSPVEVQPLDFNPQPKQPRRGTGGCERAAVGRHLAPCAHAMKRSRAAQNGDNQIDRARVLEVRIHSPPAASLQTLGPTM